MSDIDQTPEELERKLNELKQTPEKPPEKTLAQENLERDARLQGAVDREFREIAEARNLFDVNEILDDALKPRKLLIPELGDKSFHVFYCPLNSVDRVKLLRIEDDNDEVRLDLINRQSVYIMMSKADPRCTEDLVRRMPAHWIDLILTKILTEQTSFLPHLVKNVLAGLDQT